MIRILSLILASVLLAGCAGQAKNPGGTDKSVRGGKEPVNMSYTLSEPVYPKFPKQPVMPEEGPEGAWDAYLEACGKYQDALDAIRGGQAGLSDAEQAAVNAFAARSIPLALAGHEGENAVYSPLSLWSALALLAQCAGGESRQQVLEAVGAVSVDELQEQVEHIWRALYTDDGQSALILANSIWLNSNLQGTYVQDTLDILAEQYFAGAYSVPMGTDAADSAVTDWVSKQTNGLIGSDAPVVKTKPDTLALLASSLYYKAAWLEEFTKEATEEDIFTDASGWESRVDFMHKTKNAFFLRREGYQAASLATHLGEMIFVLPDQGVTPESLLQNPDFLSGLNLGAADAVRGEVRWSVPRFDVDSNLDLMSALRAMGITDLLDKDRADLTALTDLDAFLSKAKQLARVKVNEEGVEAAAVTIIMMDCTSAMPPMDPEVCVMDLDRPFLFVIREQDVPLFVGIVNQV